MAGRRPERDLSVPSVGETVELRPRKCPRRHALPDTDGDVARQLLPQGSGRPTAAERQAAQQVIDKMREADVTPKILNANAPADTAVVECAVALHFGQCLGTDQGAKDHFGIARTTDVRNRWVRGKLALLLEHDPAAMASFEHVFAATAPQPASDAGHAPIAPEPCVEREHHEQAREASCPRWIAC